MKKLPLLLTLFFLIFLGISAVSVSGNDTDKQAVTRASTQLMDQLTDELQYLVEISDALASRVYEKPFIELAGDIAQTAQNQNRKLCRLVIARSMPIKQELSDAQRKKLVSMMTLRGSSLLQNADQLLNEQFNRIDTLISQYQNNIDDREIRFFLNEMTEANQDLKHKIEILRKGGA
ncbi:MAG: hypothetical protein R2824_05985 [Saprospiraceae bacterium]